MEYKSNRNVVYSCKYHVVWRPKFRRPVLVDGVDARLKEIARDVAGETLAVVKQYIENQKRV